MESRLLIDYGFNDDPSSPNYFRYAGTYRSSGFGYVRLELPLGAQASLQETAYTYSYGNNGLSLKGDQTSSPLGSGYSSAKLAGTRAISTPPEWSSTRLARYSTGSGPSQT